MTVLRNVRRALVPLFQRHARRLHDLRFLFFELTHDCNLRCLHCGSDCVRDSGKQVLTSETVVRVLQEVRSHYDPHKITVVFSGGEPLCYPGLFRLGQAVSALEYPWGMVTNGYAWSAKTVHQAKDAGMHSVTVSLDGFTDTHDWLRGRSGSRDRARNAIAMLAAEPFWRAMDVVTCVNRRNLGELADLCEDLVRLGVRQWRLFTISPIGRAPACPELFLTPTEYHRLLGLIRDLRRRSDIHVNLSESGYLGCAHELAVRDQYYFCLAGISVAGVMVNGDILACPNIDRHFRQGNVHQDSFVTTWENKYAVFRDRDWMRVGRCRDCSDWRHCQGNSFHLWDRDAARTKLCHLKDLGLEA